MQQGAWFGMKSVTRRKSNLREFYEEDFELRDVITKKALEFSTISGAPRCVTITDEFLDSLLFANCDQ